MCEDLSIHAFSKTININPYEEYTIVIDDVMEECIMAWKTVYKTF